MALSKQTVGWLQAFFSVLILWGISNVFMTFNTQVLNVDKVVFACTTYTSCALCLLLYAGKGPLSKETLRSVDTWAYGIIMLINYFVTLNLFATVTASEASLFQRFSVIVSLLLSWVFLSRKPNKWQLFGAGLISIGLLVISAALPSSIAMKVYILMFLAAVFQSLRIFVAELHRPHKKAAENNDVKSRCRVVGYVMFVIMLLFLGLTFSFSLIQLSVPTENRLGFFVDLKQFTHAPSILMGMVMGVFIYTPIRYLEFSSSHIIKTENFLAVTALSFLSTLLWEWGTLSYTGLSLRELSSTDIIAGIIITMGALLMSISKMKEKPDENWQDFLKVETQNLDLVDDSREIIANTLEHFNSDTHKTAQALNIPTSVIEALMQDSEKVLAFKGKILQDVTRRYRRNVAMNDPLTGLINRSGFMSELKIAPTKSSNFCVLFIDLDKFKPVNDTYGHEAGDFVLIEVAHRLRELFPNNASITRLGGDEYCLLILDKEKDQLSETVQHIKQILTTPFIYNEHTITIGGSVGVAHYPTDTKTPENLLKLADKGMYKEKKER